MKQIIRMMCLLAATFTYQQSIAQSKPVYTNPIGLQAYTFRGSWDKGIEATLDTIQKLGVTELEGGPIKGMTT